jgi:hypothetical protein
VAADPRVEYARRIERWTLAIARADRWHAALANLRLVLAFGCAIAAWQVLFRGAAVAWLLAPVVAFAVAAMVHVRVVDRLERARRARQLYERGMTRIDATWAGAGADGSRFLGSHPYAHDLDLFGPGSLFQLLDTARTQIGEDTLAAWLCRGAALDEIRARQAAVAELAPNVDFREDLAVLAAESQIGRTSHLLEWSAAPAAGLKMRHAVLFAAAAAVSAVLVALVLTEQVPAGVLLLWLLLQSGLVAIFRRRIHAALSRIDNAAHDLALMASVLARIEREPFGCARLQGVRRTLGETDPPSRRIARLQRLVAALDQATLNLLFRPIGALLLIRSQVAAAIDRWHAAHGAAVAAWLGAVGDVEALSALATYSFEHPADPFPEMIEEGAVFQATALGHPLLGEKAAVTNDVRLGGGASQALIVSGSNMSGKSTLLRAIGVNVVLAQAGAPVRARRAALSRLAIGATLRVDDSLQEGHSRFFNEILRIRAIVGLAGGAPPLLFLLDEIFGGTNSHDRRLGAEAILRLLVQAGAIGLITTHDLALTELANALPGKVANVHFEDRLEDGRMVFDYQMRPGVVEHSNALALMRAIGLDV